MEWEAIDPGLERSKTPFGWLVKHTDEASTFFGEERGIDWNYEWRVSITFVFDPFHFWKPNKK